MAEQAKITITMSPELFARLERYFDRYCIEHPGANRGRIKAAIIRDMIVRELNRLESTEP